MKITPDKPQRAESVTERIVKEFDHFLLLPNTDPDADPLSWWKREQHCFPILAQLVRKYLCVCGTDVPSERLFSQTGYIVNELRTHLSPENVNMVVFLAEHAITHFGYDVTVIFLFCILCCLLHALMYSLRVSQN